MALRHATLWYYREKCTMEGKGLEHHLSGKASNMDIQREFPWPKKSR
jgi:hypothetical protein